MDVGTEGIALMRCTGPAFLKILPFARRSRFYRVLSQPPHRSLPKSVWLLLMAAGREVRSVRRAIRFENSYTPEVRATLLPRHFALFAKARSVTYVSGIKCYLSLG